MFVIVHRKRTSYTVSVISLTHVQHIISNSTTRQLKVALQRLNHTADPQMILYKSVRILKEHFKSGEWGHRSCGSVVTSTKHGKSLYCVVTKFLRSRGSGFATVKWLSVPEYPFLPNRLVVRVTLGDIELQRRYGSVLSLHDIEPTPVYVSPSEDGTHYLLMREKGYDRSHVRV